MLPDFIPHYSVGPFFGFATNSVMTILCLVTLVLYRHYCPLRSLFFFYLFSTFFFLGGVVYGLQKSPESILLGYKIDLASLALLPASWVWFISALFNERPSWLTWVVTGISLCLSALALFGQGPYFLGFPLETHQIAADILRPQSKLLRPLIHSFCLVVCFFYFFLIITRLWHFKTRRPVYLLPVAIGLLSWFLGGLHDAIRSSGLTIRERGCFVKVSGGSIHSSPGSPPPSSDYLPKAKFRARREGQREGFTGFKINFCTIRDCFWLDSKLDGVIKW